MTVKRRSTNYLNISSKLPLYQGRVVRSGSKAGYAPAKLNYQAFQSVAPAEYAQAATK